MREFSVPLMARSLMPQAGHMPKRELSRPEVALVALELLVGLSALGGSALLLADPSGAREGMPPVETYPGIPFDSYLVPGLVLLLANGLLPLVVAVGTLAGRRWARTGHLVVGAVLATWMGVQLAMMGPVFFLQAVIACIALAILGLGAHLRRRSAPV